MKIDPHARHNGWWVLNHSSVIIRKKYSDTTYESVQFTITFKRRASLGSANLILPPMIIGILILLSFILPAASGERLALSVTLLLALIFFLLNVTFLIPKDNIMIPLVYEFFIVTLSETVVLILTLILTMQCYHKTPYDPPMPRWARYFVLDRLSYVIGTRVAENEYDRYPLKVEDIESIIDAGFVSLEAYNNSNDGDRTSVCSNTYHSNPHLNDISKTQQILKEWRILALTIDRCLFVLFSFTWVVTVIGFFVKSL